VSQGISDTKWGFKHIPLSQRLLLLVYGFIGFFGKLFFFSRPFFTLAETNLVTLLSQRKPFNVWQMFDQVVDRERYHHLRVSYFVMDLLPFFVASILLLFPFLIWMVFNPMAISSKNARGLMQVMPEWAPKFNLRRVNDLHDIETGIKTGIEVLKIHIFDDAKGSIHKGLYYYVGKSDSYAPKIYEAIGKFVTFRSTIDDSHITNGNEESEVENISDTESDGDNS
jgi:hypothetical protein